MQGVLCQSYQGNPGSPIWHEETPFNRLPRASLLGADLHNHIECFEGAPTLNSRDSPITLRFVCAMYMLCWVCRRMGRFQPYYDGESPNLQFLLQKKSPFTGSSSRLVSLLPSCEIITI